jgi:gluconate 2-dehydrogenase gamma chain
MNRRESLKTIGIGALATGLLSEAFTSELPENAKTLPGPLPTEAGREPFEIARDKKIKAEHFFDAHEMATITMLADIIIPRDGKSGSASDAKVPAFIEFIVKDIPAHQMPMRGGLKWLDMQCLNRYNKSFVAITKAQQLTIIDEIAYPLKAKPEMQQGVVFFNRMRELTASGFYTTKMGIDDIGYMGNAPGTWAGVPADVLAQYGIKEE